MALFKSVSEGVGVLGPSTRIRAKAKARIVTKEVVLDISCSGNSPTEARPIFKPAGPPVVAALGKSPDATVGRSERVVLENLDQYGEVLRDPSRTSTSIGSAIADLSATLARESCSIATLTTWINERARITTPLVQRMRTEAARLADLDRKQLRIVRAELARERGERPTEGDAGGIDDLEGSFEE